ncbi:MAG: hypothetical protein ABL958_02320 [Bdellovibrionia bacterium]
MAHSKTRSHSASRAAYQLGIRTLILGVFVTCIPAFSHAASCSEFFSAPTLSLKTQIRNRLWAVRATWVFPSGGVIKAGESYSGVFRPTVHFSLGHLVAPHPWGNWEEAPIAILTPFKSLLPQMSNLLAQDTFVVGDFQLPKEAVIIVREDIEIPVTSLNSSVRIIRFPKNQPLRQAVESILERLRSIKVELEFDFDDGFVYKMSEVTKTDNIETESFWRSQQVAAAWVSNKLHSETAFQVLEGLKDSVLNVLNKENSDTYLYALSNKQKKAREAAAEVDSQISQMRLKGLALESWNRMRAELDGYLNLLDAEVWLLQTHKKTWRPRLSEHGEQLWRLRHSPADLVKYLEANLEQLPLERGARER